MKARRITQLEGKPAEGKLALVRPFLWVGVLAALGLLFLGLGQSSAAAQEAEASAPTEVPAVPPAVPPANTGPAPVVVLTVASEQLAPPISAAIRDAVVAHLTPRVRRRPVTAVTSEETIAQARACEDPACVGAVIAREGAVLGVVITASRRNLRSPTEVTIDLLDPISGQSRLSAPLEGSIEPEQVEAPALIIDAMLADIGTHLPAAPPQTTLLVTSNVDGATITINGQAIGETPMVPGQLPAGTYQIQAAREGFRGQSRRIDVAAGEAARVDFAMEPSEETARLDAAGLDYRDQAPPPLEEDGSITSEWWFWTAIGGAVLVIGTVVIIAATSGGDEGPVRESIPIPPLR